MRKYIARKKQCSFCKENLEIDWKEASLLRNFTTDRGKILSRSKTGTCAYHQRRLAQAIKRARHIALLPFVAQL